MLTLYKNHITHIELWFDFFNNETLSESEIKKCKKFFTSYIKQIESIWYMRNYYHEIKEAKEVCEKCLQWIDEYEQNIETAFN